MNPQLSGRYVFDFDAPPTLPADELRGLLGGKAANLVVMANELGLPVPVGFTVTTEACLAYLNGSWPDGLSGELRAHMDRLGERLGRRFGDAADPLLVSVRSGAPVSMPGMMDTILNLGLNEATANGLARSVSGGSAFAADCLRRFRESYLAVIGDSEVPADPWQQLHAAFAADCLRRFRESYLAVIGGPDVPADPWQQLRAAVEAVFRSWNSERARAYRQREGIADDMGTAVTVQAMVFGNRGPDSGTGVLFTRNPSTGEPALYGDIMFDAQGEDVVAGTHATEPIAALDSRLPEVAAELRRYAAVLEHHYADLCDIEFTIEDGRLWLLQVRVGKRSPRAALRMAIDMALDPEFPLDREAAVRRVAGLLADPPRVFEREDRAAAPLAVGLPASPGVAVGAVVTSSDAAVEAGDRGESVILVRDETSPEDVRGMARAAGVLTARGGLASHAAVVARGWGIPAVVGAGEIAHSLAPGELISIDGATGEIFRGQLRGSWAVAPEAATLRGWARELGIEVESAGTGESEAEVAAAEDAAAPVSITADDVLRSISIRGAVSPEQLAEGLLSVPESVISITDELAERGLIDKAAGQVRLSANGKIEATEMFAADRSAVGGARAEELLEEFHAFDGRMKDVVTAWQVRDIAGEQVLNDHGDAEYDAKVLGDLAALHGDTAEWLTPLTSMRRFAVYRTRLARALGLAQSDQRYVASPRVDSYHSVWFELHEDLIRLAGRKRAEIAG